MSDTGAVAPVSTSQTGTGASWSNPDNALVINDGLITIASQGTADSMSLDLAFADFAIDPAATIAGIEVTLRWSRVTPNFTLTISVGGVAKTFPANTSSLHTTTLGGAADLWGRSDWTPDDFSAAVVSIMAGGDGGSGSKCSVDGLTLKIYYNIAATGSSDITATGALSHIQTADVTTAGRFSIPHSKDASASVFLSRAGTKEVSGSMIANVPGHNDVPALGTMTVKPGLNVVGSGIASRTVHDDLPSAGVVAQAAAASVGGSALIQQAVNSDVDGNAQFESARALVFASVVISAYGPLIPTIAIARITGRPSPAIARMKRPGG